MEVRCERQQSTHITNLDLDQKYSTHRLKQTQSKRNRRENKAKPTPQTFDQESAGEREKPSRVRSEEKVEL